MDSKTLHRSHEPFVHQFTGHRLVGENLDPLLSIKCMFNGTGHYTTSTGSRFSVDDDSYLILNRSHGYAIEKNSSTPVETFCLFFPDAAVATVTHDLTASSDELLQPRAKTATTFNFFETLNAHGDHISSRVKALRWMLEKRARAKIPVEDCELEQIQLTLLADMVMNHRTVARHIERLPWARLSTRRELHRRIHLGRDHLHAHIGEPFSLTDTASAAMLSRYHFLRAFKTIIGATPVKYLQRLRIYRATRLLEQTTASVTDIAYVVGYRSLPTFSSLFRSHIGVAPSVYRSQLRKRAT